MKQVLVLLLAVLTFTAVKAQKAATKATPPQHTIVTDTTKVDSTLIIEPKQYYFVLPAADADVLLQNLATTNVPSRITTVISQQRMQQLARNNPRIFKVQENPHFAADSIRARMSKH